MSLRYRMLSIFLALTGLLRAVRLSAPPPSALPMDSRHSTEEAFAFGEPISMWTADQWDLELIPGVSDRLAKRILADLPTLRAQADTLSGDMAWRSLLAVRGIGKVSAEKLRCYLDFRDPRQSEDSFPERPRAARAPPLRNIFEE